MLDIQRELISNPSVFNPKSILEKRLLEGMQSRISEPDFDGLKTASNESLTALLLSRELVPRIEHLLEPQSFAEYRQRWIKSTIDSVLTNVKLERNSHQPGNFLENFHDEVYLTGWVCSSLGIVVDQETEECLKFFTENDISPIENKKLDKEVAKKILKELTTTIQTKEAPEDKIFSLRAAKEQIRRLKIDGFRTAIAFGAWDLKHGGHERFLKKAKRLLGKYGQLFVAVDPDILVTISKGSRRPIIPQEDRAESLSNLIFVDGVIPLPAPRQMINTNIETFFQKIQIDLSPHFRVLGEVDNNFDLYKEQCKRAGVGLIYSDNKNETSTTETINKILEIHNI